MIGVKKKSNVCSLKKLAIQCVHKHSMFYTRKGTFPFGVLFFPEWWLEQRKSTEWTN